MSESACQETNKERSVTYKSEKLTKSPKSNLNDSAADINLKIEIHGMYSKNS
jgi:hypothetical protein